MGETDPTEPTDETPETEPAPKAPMLPERSRNPLARDSDFVARPGFRNPPNKNAKAQKKSGSGKKKRG